EGKGSGQPSEPQYTPTTALPSHVVPIPTVASSSHPKKTHKHRKPKSKATKISQSSGPTTLVADETVHEERGDSIERAATTAASLDAEQDSGNIIRTQSMAILNKPIPQGTGSGSGPRRQDTILKDRPTQTRLSERVLALENIKTAQNLEIINLKKKVKKLEKNKKARTPQLKRRLFKVRIESSTKKSLETQGRYAHDFEVNIASTSITTASINITTVEPVTTASAPVTTAGVSFSIAEPINWESARDVYSRNRIIAIKKLTIVEWHNYKHLEWITVHRDDDKRYTFKEGDYNRLRLQDIEYMLLLLVQGKLTNLNIEERLALDVSL
ncbi:hypothetical protein Tco_0723810, partial [Tanacetum coccineum]